MKTASYNTVNCYIRCRFVDPLINGHYPQIMQDLVKERLPRFTPEQAKLVKGSADYIGINEYTSSYMKGQKLLQQTPSSYSADWQVQYVCEFLALNSIFYKNIFALDIFSPNLNICPINSVVARNGKPIGPKVCSSSIYSFSTLFTSLALHSAYYATISYKFKSTAINPC
jgi:beta-glucosidase